MKHFFNYSVVQDLSAIPGDDPDCMNRLRAMGCDGLELSTLFEEVPEIYDPVSPAVHLPFAIDWYRGWTEDVYDDTISDEDLKYATFGRTKEDVVSNVRYAITCANRISPAYGILHAANTNFDQVFYRHHTRGDKIVIEAFIEMVNEVVSGFKGGEPPFKLAFENLWWEGLRLRENWEYELMDKKLEFDNWGFCLDTGHLMNTLPDTFDETSAINGVLKVIDGYSQDMKDRINNMHFHVSTSAEYRATFEVMERPKDETIMETIRRSYPHVMKIDQHRPFSDPRCVEIVKAIDPEYVTHEMVGSGTGDPVKDFIQQRSLFAEQ